MTGRRGVSLSLSPPRSACLPTACVSGTSSKKTQAINTTVASSQRGSRQVASAEGEEEIKEDNVDKKEVATPARKAPMTPAVAVRACTKRKA